MAAMVQSKQITSFQFPGTESAGYEVPESMKSDISCLILASSSSPPAFRRLQCEKKSGSPGMRPVSYSYRAKEV